MGTLRIGDLVTRKSYNCDIIFKVTDIKDLGNEKIAILKGVVYRLRADAPERDLILKVLL